MAAIACILLFRDAFSDAPIPVQRLPPNI